MSSSPYLRSRTPRVQLVGIETPGNAVELDIGAGDAAEQVDGQQVEALDWILANAGELPVPHELVAGVHEVEGFDALLGMLGDFSHPLVPGCRGWGVDELGERSSVTCGWRVRIRDY